MDPLLILACGMAVVLGGILWLRLHAFLALLLGGLAVGWLSTEAQRQAYFEGKGNSETKAAQMAAASTPNRLTEALGKTAGKLAVLIALASLIGKALMESGAAERIVRTALKVGGERSAPGAFLGSGFFLGIPVFFDTVFYLLIPLGRALGLRHPGRYGLYLMCIIAGTTMAHSLVPPTPGPLFAAQELGVSIGAMMIGGLVVGFFSCLAGGVYAYRFYRRFNIPLREQVDAPLEALRGLTEKSDKELPPVLWSLSPILLPVFLIAGATVLALPSVSPSVPNWLASTFGILGDKNLALGLAAIAALVLRARYGPKADPGSKDPFGVGQALASAGTIILITCAGGAFGAMLQQTGIGERIQAMAGDAQLAILPLAFLVTTLVRTAQGSATVAMITAVGLIGGLATPEQLGFHPVYLALAVGCGSKPYPWMNDSGFWVITKMGGLEERETFQVFSGLLTVMGVTGLLATMMLAKVFPMLP